MQTVPRFQFASLLCAMDWAYPVGASGLGFPLC